ncbi:M23 family metallopeptidase [Patescibacteria group bacterium]|nr:M23 family metallopeptidase [Patescibacteria group bacterium]
MSKRFVEINFSNFLPHGRNELLAFLKQVALFGRWLGVYLVLKSKKAVLLLVGSLVFLIKRAQAAKGYVVAKLIWSRGRLGRPVANFVVMFLAFSVFFFGEILSGSKLVVSKEVDEDYLKTTIDIIPERNTALTTIPEERQRTEYLAYTIESGDSLYSIGTKFKVSVDALKYVNNLYDGSVLKVGSEIVIPPSSGLIHKVAAGDTLATIASKYSVAAQAIADFNYLLEPNKLALGTELVIPDAKIPQPVVIDLPLPLSAIVGPGRVDPRASKGWCMWPTAVSIITQKFSWYHNGLDIASSWGSNMPPIYACASGVVIRAGWDPFGLGLHVRVDHGNGYETVYGHMSRLDVSYGDKVSKGEMIGLMGSTGRSTGPHIHFMIKFQGSPQDPLNYI